MFYKLPRIPFTMALLVVLLLPTLVVAGVDEKERTCVLLLHGLGRTSWSMSDMEDALEKEGYLTVNLGYPSRHQRIEDLAMNIIPKGIEVCREKGGASINFVTHSMGGILLRYYLSQEELKGLAHVVMLSPPNQGSEAADYLKEKGYYKWFNGPAGQQLGTDPKSLVMQLGPVNFPLGIITGDRHSFFDGRLADIIPGDDDGKVSVKRAKIKGMTDFMVLPYNHTTIMDKEEVIRQTLYFLENATFNHESVIPMGVK